MRSRLSRLPPARGRGELRGQLPLRRGRPTPLPSGRPGEAFSAASSSPNQAGQRPAQRAQRDAGIPGQSFSSVRRQQVLLRGGQTGAARLPPHLETWAPAPFSLEPRISRGAGQATHVHALGLGGRDRNAGSWVSPVHCRSGRTRYPAAGSPFSLLFFSLIIGRLILL